MNFIKNISKSLAFSFLSIILLTTLTTLLSYFNLITTNIVNIIFYIIPFISFLIGGYLIGKKSNNKGYINGLKFSIFPIIIIFIFNLIVTNKFFILGDLILYSIIIISSILGSILGINKKI